MKMVYNTQEQNKALNANKRNNNISPIISNESNNENNTDEMSFLSSNYEAKKLTDLKLSTMDIDTLSIS